MAVRKKPAATVAEQPKTKAPAKKAAAKPAPRKRAVKPAAPKQQDTGLVKPEPPTVSEDGAEKSIEVQREAISKDFAALSHRHQVFIEVYVGTLNATEAAIRAGYSDRGTTAATMGCRLLKDERLAPIIDFMIKDGLRDIEMSRQRVLTMIEGMAKADANELVELRRVCCRFCHNPEHVYMETPAEHRDRKIKHEFETARCEVRGEDERLFPVWDETIIVGFNGTLPPDPECPECFGEGTERLFFKDTRNLSPEARSIYLGANWGKDGLKVNFTSRESAVDKLARHHKLYEDKVEVSVVSLDQKTLEEKFIAKMQAAHERMATIRKERGLESAGEADGD